MVLKNHLIYRLNLEFILQWFKLILLLYQIGLIGLIAQLN